jgi:hypothetical protein
MWYKRGVAWPVRFSIAPRRFMHFSIAPAGIACQVLGACRTAMFPKRILGNRFAVNRLRRLCDCRRRRSRQGRHAGCSGNLRSSHASALTGIRMRNVAPPDAFAKA